MRKTSSELVRLTNCTLSGTRHEYNVIRIWELPTESLLQASGLLPFAVLSNTENPVEVLSQVAQKIETITEHREKSNIAASTAIIAGLVLKKNIIQKLLREELMKESVIYQDILAIGEDLGIQKGIQQGIQQGRQQGEVAIILKLLNRRFGPVSLDIATQIHQLNIAQLEDLGIALLDFQSETDLLNMNAQYF